MSTRHARTESAAGAAAADDALRLARKVRADLDALQTRMGVVHSAAKRAEAVALGSIACASDTEIALSVITGFIAQTFPVEARETMAAGLQRWADGLTDRPALSRALSRAVLIVREGPDNTTAFDHVQRERPDVFPEHPEGGR